MARKLIEHIYDDLDGTLINSPDDGNTVTFTIDQATYEIDLTRAHAEELKTSLQPFIKVARKVRPPQPARRAQRSKEKLDEIREWARANGYRVSDRGRIPFAVVDAYDQAP